MGQFSSHRCPVTTMLTSTVLLSVITSQRTALSPGLRTGSRTDRQSSVLTFLSLRTVWTTKVQLCRGGRETELSTLTKDVGLEDREGGREGGKEGDRTTGEVSSSPGGSSLCQNRGEEDRQETLASPSGSSTTRPEETELITSTSLMMTAAPDRRLAAPAPRPCWCPAATATSHPRGSWWRCSTRLMRMVTTPPGTTCQPLLLHLPMSGDSWTTSLRSMAESSTETWF